MRKASLLVIVCLGLQLAGCMAVSAVGTAVDVAGTAVSTTASVAGSAVSGTANAVSGCSDKDC